MEVAKPLEDGNGEPGSHRKVATRLEAAAQTTVNMEDYFMAEYAAEATNLDEAQRGLEPEPEGSPPAGETTRDSSQPPATASNRRWKRMQDSRSRSGSLPLRRRPTRSLTASMTLLEKQQIGTMISLSGHSSSAIKSSRRWTSLHAAESHNRCPA